MEREAYRQLGGHAAVADKVLEDVELAFLAKRRKVGLRFRYAEDAVATRMYRTTAAMIEGWTKNLALLFNNALATALWRALDIALAGGAAVAGDRAVERAFCGAFACEWLGAGWVLLAALGAEPGPVLRAGGEVEFSVRGLRAFAAGIAAVCLAAVSKLVSAPGSEAGKLEGQELRGVDGTWMDRTSSYPNFDVTQMTDELGEAMRRLEAS